MMDLFVVTNSRAFPSPHALLIEPFKTIWEKDMTPTKEEAIKIFTYVELLCSPKKSNPFAGEPDDTRPAKVKKEVWGDFPPLDRVAEIIGAVETYKKFLETASPTYYMYIAAKEVAQNLIAQVRNFNLDQRTTSGALVMKPKDASGAINDIAENMKTVETLRTLVNQELIESSKTRNQRRIGDYER